MKQNLAAHFADAAKHHLEMSKCEKAKGDCFAKLRDLSKTTADGNRGTITTACDELAQHFAASSDHHVAAGESCAAISKLLSQTKKAAGLGDDFDEIVPTRISGVAREAITRAGMPAFPTSRHDDVVGKVFGGGEDAA